MRISDWSSDVCSSDLQIEEIGWILDEAGNSKFVRVIPTIWVFGRDRAHARDLAARAKRLWEGEPLPFSMQAESYLNPTLLVMSLPFGLYPDRTTLRLQNGSASCREHVWQYV